MKTITGYAFALFLAGFTLLPSRPLSAQTFTTLHSFTSGKGGSQPMDGPIISSNTLYGTTSMGGEDNSVSNVPGTVYAINIDGSGFTNVHTFAQLNNGPTTAYFPTNTQGANPFARPLLFGNTLYGTTWDGGDGGVGGVFRVNIDGTGFTNLYSFSFPATTAFGEPVNHDGAFCESVLAIGGETLYGVADFGGTAGNGTLFAINIDGSGFTNLHNFSAVQGTDTSSVNGGTNSDGSEPYGGVFVSGDILYGTAQYGGANGNGTVFEESTNGMDFAALYSFETINLSNSTNGDGATPVAAPILSGSTLYGITTLGGPLSGGVVFALNIDDMSITNLHSFSYDFGLYPNPELTLSGNTLYGTVTYGGSSKNGALFAINTDGTGFTNLHSFTRTSGGVNLEGVSIGANLDGANPRGSVAISGTALYGTTENGGAYGDGTVYSISFAPQLAVALSGTNVVLTWPTNVAGFSYAGYTLQSTTNLAPPATWTTVAPGAAINASQYVVTNAISGTQQFYRLSQSQ